MIRVATISFSITLLILCALMFLLEFAPFGGASFANDDAVIQYLDFFAYLQRLLTGDASLTFSFEKGLGGNVFAMLTYYLFSPLNFLIAFFDRTELHTFYDLLVVLKLSLSSAAMALYLTRRFDGRLSLPLTVLLSMSFGLMQYNLEQAKNIMWLDGVWLLPMILLGADRLRRRNDPLLFTLSAALAIIFNWYSGLISTMFAGLFATWEFIFVDKRLTWKNFLSFELKVLGAMMLALGLSMIIFLPTMEALSGGRAGIDWHELSLHYNGKPLNIFDGFTWGLTSRQSEAVLFSGDLVTFGAAAFFLRRSLNRRIVIGGLTLLTFIWLMFYWQPLFWIFSLLKSATSYWYRYSYAASFMLIWLTAHFLLKRERLPRRPLTFIVLSIFPIVILAHQMHAPFNAWINVLGSLMIYLMWTANFLLGPSKSKLISWALIGLTTIGLTLNAAQVMIRTAYRNVEDFRQYSRQQAEQVERLKAFDDGAYRVTQSRPGVYSSQTVEIYFTANYNEGAAYEYRPLASYTSSPSNAQLRLLDRLGYRQNGDNMNIVNVPVLPTDSLLGVKYIFSDLPIDGLTALDELGTLNAKKIYRNEYALPPAFVCNDFISLDIEGNPFERTNAIFSQLSGMDVAIYKPIEHTVEKINDAELKMTLKAPKIGALYGNIPVDRDYDGVISIDGKDRYGCARWLGTSVFYIPRGASDSIEVVLKTDRAMEKIFEPQFYVTDGAALMKAIKTIRAAEILTFEDDHVALKIDGRGGEKLFTSLPFDSGWTAYLNGREVEPTLIADCLMGFELDDGENILELEYNLPGLKLGALVTALSVMMLAAWKVKA